jgi:hypothetical protein
MVKTTTEYQWKICAVYLCKNFRPREGLLVKLAAFLADEVGGFRPGQSVL